MLSGFSEASEAQKDTANPAAQIEQQKGDPGPSGTTPLPESPKAIPASEKDQTKASIYKSACGDTKDHDEADLCEQRRMSQAAIDAVWWAKWQTTLGGLGFVSVVVSLFFTGWAAIAAAQAAKAARHSVTVASDTADKQLRAYVCNTKGSIRNLAIGKEPQAHVIMTNAGQTPAYDFISWIGAAIGPYNPDLPIPPNGPDMSRPAKSVIGPGMEKHLSVFLGPLTQDQADGLDAGKYAFHVIGGATYRDAFGQMRETTFNLYYGGPNGMNAGMALVNAHHGNTAT